MNRQQIGTSAVVLALLLGAVTGLSQAKGPERPDAELRQGSVAAPPPEWSNYIPIQGRLTDASGNPLDGNYSMTFRLYDVYSGGTALCQDANTVKVDNGLFTTAMKATDCPINGQNLYLGIKVGTDPEMTPRQHVDNVPYAWSLRPGAHIAGAVTASPYAALHVWNTASSGSAYGVKGGTSSPYGRGIFGEGLNGGTGVHGGSDTGVAIRAGGSGVIQSTAKSYVWISGNGLRPQHESDSTVIDLDSIGGAKVTPGATASPRYVMLPVTVTGPLFGQNVTVSGLEIYWVGNTDMDSISDIRLRRQTGVCNSCYVDILHDSTDHICHEDGHAEGCIVHYNLTANNVLSEDSGILYLMMQLMASASDSWIRIGGARLTLEHD